MKDLVKKKLNSNMRASTKKKQITIKRGLKSKRRIDEFNNDFDNIEQIKTDQHIDRELGKIKKIEIINDNELKKESISVKNMRNLSQRGANQISLGHLKFSRFRDTKTNVYLQDKRKII